MIYFISGPDRLLGREAAVAIASEFDPSGSSTTWLDGRETSYATIASAIGAASLFNDPRIVIVTDLLGRAARESETGQAAGEGEERSGRGGAELESLVSSVPDSHHLILFEPTLITVPAMLKKAAPGLKVVSGEPPRGSELLAWIGSTALQSGARIDRRTAQRLAEMLYPQTWQRKPSNPRYDRPPDLALLRGELEKLALAAHPGEITVEHLTSLTPATPDQHVFRFLDAALMGDLRTGLHELESLLAAAQEPAMLLAQLLGQVELATVAAAAVGKSAESVARDLGSVAPGRMSSVMAAIRGQEPRALRAAGLAARSDRALKTGQLRNPEDALRELILALASSEPCASSYDTT